MTRTIIAALALVISFASNAFAQEKSYLVIELKSGPVKIEMLPEHAPNHVARITQLANSGAYDGVAFHRVIDGFMAQTGDVRFGKVKPDGTIDDRAGTGGSDLPNISVEISDLSFVRGAVGMARAQSRSSANSQFFIMFEDDSRLDPDYTIWGKVVDGMQHVDNIKLGNRAAGGRVDVPDQMITVRVVSE